MKYRKQLNLLTLICKRIYGFFLIFVMIYYCYLLISHPFISFLLGTLLHTGAFFVSFFAIFKFLGCFFNFFLFILNPEKREEQLKDVVLSMKVALISAGVGLGVYYLMSYQFMNSDRHFTGSYLFPSSKRETMFDFFLIGGICAGFLFTVRFYWRLLKGE
ncbi:hypothetical protein [Photobacterium galatheae]|uniref:Uncharacterized protein n=1 Tax=Photobacterium galatheae TaxID=1654360 RepID=A0A066RN57_9GAMM|nr:hypothetical protein [Photobacterium galatheae]KDM90551.1 hypothetical protein EA58_16660 [Photobacterium galatheae]MCM0148075.1 hypothetical protein [Photobacterium galatheae]